MIDDSANLKRLIKKSEGARSEYEIAFSKSAYKGAYELVGAYQELGHSFEDATRAVFDGVTTIILETCRGRCEQNDEISIMKATIERRTTEYNEF